MSPHLRGRRGFTLVELLTVMVVMGVLASIAILRYMDMTNEALAGKVGNEMQQIRLAAIAYYVEAQDFPPAAGSGVRPPLLDPLLSEAATFSNAAYSMEWVNDGSPDGLVGVIVYSTRAGLATKLRQRLVYGNPYVPYGSDVMYIIRGPGISM